MEIGKLPMAIVGITIAVIVCAVVLIPVVQESTTTHTTFVNEGVFFMTDDTTDYVLDYRGTTGDLYLGETKICNRSDLPTASWTLISTPDYLIRLQNFGSQNYSVWLIGMNGTNSVIANNTNESVTITVTDDKITTSTNLEYSYSGDFRGIAPTGDYVMTDGTNKPTVNNTDSIIVGCGTTNVIHWYDMFYINGTVDDMDVDGITGVTVTNITVNAEPLTEYLNASILSSVTFTATDGEDATVNATYDRIIVPASVTLEKSIHADQTTIQLLNVIPLLVIISIVMLAVATMIYTRK